MRPVFTAFAMFNARVITRALNIAKAVKTGRIWINTYNQVPEGAPFGGYKKSGIGRETYKEALSNYQL